MEHGFSAEEALNEIGELDKLAVVSQHWEDSQKYLPAGGPAFLKEQAVRENLEWCGFDPQVDAQFLAAAEKIRSNPAILQLAWHCAWSLYECPEESYFSAWPDFRNVLGEDGGLFYLLVGIAMAPKVRAHHQRLGVPEAVTRETCLEPFAFCLNYQHMAQGRMGIPRSQLFWLRHYTREPYFRLGRFEFWLKPFDAQLRVYRRRSSGRVVAFFTEEHRLDAEGFMPVEGEPVSTGEWTSTWIEAHGKVSGNPVLPSGKVACEALTLDLSEWDCVLAPKDWVVDMHIPAGGKMTPGACRDSFTRAKDFFQRYFPETPPKAAVCWSWIYSPVLDRVLPEDSNLVRNMRESYLFPYPSDAKDGLGFIFYQDDIDLATAPAETSVQRAFLDYLNQGNRWRCGAMLHLLDDFERYGSQVYRQPFIDFLT